jgi:hypothetical protein
MAEAQTCEAVGTLAPFSKGFLNHVRKKTFENYATFVLAIICIM